MKHAKLLLAGIVILFLAQELIGINLRWVDDETWYLLPAQSLLREGKLRIPVFAGIGRDFFTCPLLPVLEAATARIGGLSAVQARLLTVFFGVGVIVLTHSLARRLFDERVGLVAAALCAVDNMVFLAGRTVRPEILVCFFTLLALDLLLKSLQEDRLWPVLLSGCAVAAGVATHPNGAAAALCGTALLLWYQGWAAVRKPRLYLFALSSFMAFLPLAVFILVNDASRNFEGLRSLAQLHSGGQSSLLQNLLASAQHEISVRYAAFIMFPYRLPIALLVLASVVIGFSRRNRATRFLATCIILYPLFFWAVVKYNKSPRYLALIMPLVAILWADWLVVLWSRWRIALPAPRSKRILPLIAVASLALLVGLAPFGGNIGYLWKYRRADISGTCRQIDELIPANSTIYGGMAFWIGLQRHTYVPYMRMPWNEAVSEFRPNVVILDDWVMVAKDSPYSNWDELRRELHDYVDHHGRLLGEIDNPFYGDLKIYAVTHPDREAAARETPPAAPGPASL